MGEITETMKLHIHVTDRQDTLFDGFTRRYAEACDFVSQYIFDNGFPLNMNTVHAALYHTVRNRFGMKAQMTLSVFKTVIARYKTVKEQLKKRPYRYASGFRNGRPVWKYIPRTLEWLWTPVRFSRPQADLVRGRDYSFLNGGTILSLATLEGRERVTFDVPDYFKEKFLDGTWRFGGGKLVKLNGEWYFHVSMTKTDIPETDTAKPSHIVGVDRGLRFLAATYDDEGKTGFYSGKEVMRKRQAYADTRAGLQSRGTKSAKRVLKRISGRENRWMTDVNHRLSKALVSKYGRNALFVLEDLTGVSFEESNLGDDARANRNLRSWAFYQLEEFLKYKSAAVGAAVINVRPEYTSQRCPKCGRVHKENRNHETHEYVCDVCGFRSNDDRVGAMNLEELGVMYVAGDPDPMFWPELGE